VKLYLFIAEEPGDQVIFVVGNDIDNCIVVNPKDFLVGLLQASNLLKAKNDQVR